MIVVCVGHPLNVNIGVVYISPASSSSYCCPLFDYLGSLPANLILQRSPVSVSLFLIKILLS